jgi:hypothetical protein
MAITAWGQRVFTDRPGVRLLRSAQVRQDSTDWPILLTRVDFWVDGWATIIVQILDAEAAAKRPVGVRVWADDARIPVRQRLWVPDSPDEREIDAHTGILMNGQRIAVSWGRNRVSGTLAEHTGLLHLRHRPPFQP